MTPQKRVAVLTDHGYNPTPLWSVGGHWLTNLAPISEGQMFWLSLIDPVLVIILFALVWWAFGWQPLCLALVWWGTNYPARYDYVGGALVRQDWLVLVVASLCFARRRFMAASGFTLVWSAMLRIFPGIIGLGLALKILQQCWTAGRISLTADQWQFAAGALLALTVLFPVSLTVGPQGHRTAIWTAFVVNSEKHLATPFTNNIGLPTLIAFEPATRIATMADVWVSSPWDVWTQARRRVFAERRPIYLAIVVSFLVALAIAVRNAEDWVALTLGVAVIPILADLASYYYSVLLALACLWPRLPIAGIALALASFASAVVPALLVAEDERYMAISLVSVALAAIVIASMALRRRPRAGADQSVIAAPR